MTRCLIGYHDSSRLKSGGIRIGYGTNTPVRSGLLDLTLRDGALFEAR